ncbi:hypothetical protein BX600DRAFT_434275 [Xylariales sp. PMI_506]|nr:hypothetical protein BX600DRAFT_434275 [Xylariales sp. PMI_506]
MASCKVCDEPLLLQLDDDVFEGGEPQSIPDDLELACGCHFHWQCLMDQAAEVGISLSCPSCKTQLATNQAGPSVTNPFLHATSGASILARYHNEGGLQEGYDILPEITEEAYLAANPEARPARAFHVMCSEGDVEGILEVLKDAEQPSEEGDDPKLGALKLLRYQDPLGGSKSGVHLAIEKGQEEVVWLLLWLASPLPAHAFPEAAVNTAAAMGINRPTTVRAEDIRLLQDDGGRTAEAVAAEMDGLWRAMINAGVLHPST